jgi:hypothetical protein
MLSKGKVICVLGIVFCMSVLDVSLKASIDRGAIQGTMAWLATW